MWKLLPSEPYYYSLPPPLSTLQEVNRELYRMKERWEKTKEERGLQDRSGRYSHTAQREGGHRW